MDIRQLRYFVTVADTGHLTRAAVQLGMQQPPLSQQIKSLEAQLGVTLFVRHPKGMALTPVGEEVLAEARLALQAFDTMAQRVACITSGLHGVLQLGMTTSAAVHAFTSQAIRTLRHEHPSVELAITEANAAGITEAVAASRLHCGFIRAVVSRPAGLVFETLAREPTVVALPVDHPLAARRPTGRHAVRLEDLHEQNMILVRRPGAPGLYADLLRRCEEAQVRPRVVEEVERMTTSLSLVAGGVGLSVVPASMQRAPAATVTYRPLASSVGLDAPLTLVYREDDRSGVAASFVQLVQRLAADAGHQGWRECA
jgi:DNA-binding transcriptional LysR family regulator